jgi:hypothetical protein
LYAEHQFIFCERQIFTVFLIVGIYCLKHFYANYSTIYHYIRTFFPAAKLNKFNEKKHILVWSSFLQNRKHCVIFVVNKKWFAIIMMKHIFFFLSLPTSLAHLSTLSDTCFQKIVKSTFKVHIMFIPTAAHNVVCAATSQPRVVAIIWEL